MTSFEVDSKRNRRDAMICVPCNDECTENSIVFAPSCSPSERSCVAGRPQRLAVVAPLAERTIVARVRATVAICRVETSRIKACRVKATERVGAVSRVKATPPPRGS